MKKIIIAGLLLAGVAAAQIVPHYGTNQVAAVLRPETNRTVTVEFNQTGDSGSISIPARPVFLGIITSNTWSLYDATNGLNNGDWRICSSNWALVAVSLTNGTTPIIKQIAP